MDRNEDEERNGNKKRSRKENCVPYFLEMV
jgi:hypothetical protein